MAGQRVHFAMHDKRNALTEDDDIPRSCSHRLNGVDPQPGCVHCDRQIELARRDLDRDRNGDWDRQGEHRVPVFDWDLRLMQRDMRRQDAIDAAIDSDEPAEIAAIESIE